MWPVSNDSCHSEKILRYTKLDRDFGHGLLGISTCSAFDGVEFHLVSSQLSITFNGPRQPCQGFICFRQILKLTSREAGMVMRQP